MIPDADATGTVCRRRHHHHQQQQQQQQRQQQRQPLSRQLNYSAAMSRHGHRQQQQQQHDSASGGGGGGGSTVRRCRLRNQLRMMQMVDRCGYLRKENALLEEKVDSLVDELNFLKEMFLKHASGKNTSVNRCDFDRVMSNTMPGPDVTRLLAQVLPSVTAEADTTVTTTTDATVPSHQRT